MAGRGDFQLQLLLEEVGRHVAAAAAADTADGLIDLILQTQQCVCVCVFTQWKIFFHI